MKKVYVLAILGTSPAVLTELVWHLVKRDGCDVVGVEVWTTADPEGHVGPSFTGMAKLVKEVQTGLWDRLVEALGHERVPPGPQLLAYRPLPDKARLARGERAFSVAAFTDEAGRPLSDIRDVDDAERVLQLLHDRVRDLRRDLPEDVALYGSLAGGRKTMSAALQSAFSIHAGVQDRLLHVLLHPAIEGDRDAFFAFRFPAGPLDVPGFGVVPEKDQVRVYAVQFPLLRLLIRDAAVWEALDSAGYETALTVLRQRAAQEELPTATLREVVSGRHGARHFLLDVHDGLTPLDPIRLPDKQGEMYGAFCAVCARHGRVVSSREVHEFLASADAPGWVRQEGRTKVTVDPGETRAPTYAKRVNQTLRDLRARHLGEFLIESVDGGWTVAAASRVRIEPATL